MKFDIIEYFKKIKSQYKVTFISTLIFGIIAHGMGLFNKYSFSDDIGGGFNGLGATITSGRWMLEIFSKVELLIFGDGHFSMPVFNGLISIIFIAISACLLVSLLEIKNNTLCVVIGGIMVVFPTVTGIFNYMFAAPSYMLSLLMSVYGAYIICKSDKWYLNFIGIILIACSIGVYQAFIPFMLSIFVVYLIKVCSYSDIELNELIRKAIRIFISVILSAVVYFLINKFALSLIDAQLTSYLGIDTMGKESMTDYLYRVAYAYGRFFILDDSKKYYMYYANIKYVHYATLFISFVLAFDILKNKYKENKVLTVFILVLFAIVPLASNFIFVMVDPSNIHGLMMYGQIAPYILLVLLLDNLETESKVFSCLSTITIVILLFINIMYCRFDNQCYLKAEYVQEEAISYFTTLVTRIKSTENYDDELPVSFIFIDGSRIEDKSIYDIENLDYINLIQYDELYYYINNYEWKTFMKRWCGYDPVIVDGSDLQNNEEVKAMACYPDYGSIKVIDDRVVVRFQ